MANWYGSLQAVATIPVLMQAFTPTQANAVASHSTPELTKLGAEIAEVAQREWTASVFRAEVANKGTVSPSQTDSDVFFYGALDLESEIGYRAGYDIDIVRTLPWKDNASSLGIAEFVDSLSPNLTVLADAREWKSLRAKIDPVISHQDRLYSDAQIFGELVKELPWRPTTWEADGEIVFEWIDGDRHAIVSVEGDGQIGYTMLVDDTFIPGEAEWPSVSVLPEDLKAYILSA